jgi:hypothetical protein
MKLRANLDALRDLAAALRSSGKVNSAILVEDAIKDIECLSEDLEMEREMTRDMCAALAIRNPPL